MGLAPTLCYLPFGLRRDPVWRDSSNVKRERAVRDGYGIEGMSSDNGILLGIILNFCHFLSDLKGLTLEVVANKLNYFKIVLIVLACCSSFLPVIWRPHWREYRLRFHNLS